MIDSEPLLPLGGQVRWKPVSILTCLMLGAGSAFLAAQQPSGTIKFDLWQKDRVFGSGTYKAARPVSIDGRQDRPGGDAERATMTIASGMTVLDSEFLCAHSNWNVEQAKLTGVILRLGPANTVEARKAEFTDGTLSFGLRDVEEAAEPGASMPAPTNNSNRILLEECILTGCRLFRAITPSRTVLQWTGSTFTRLALPEIVFTSDAGAELALAGTRIERCHFKECEVPVSFLLATNECTFENCTFPGDTPMELREPARIAVAGTPPVLRASRIEFTEAPAGGGSPTPATREQ